MVFQIRKSSYTEHINQVSATRPTRIVVSVTFLAVGVNTFPMYDSHYHDCHDNFNIFVKTILTKKLWLVKPEISLCVAQQTTTISTRLDSNVRIETRIRTTVT